MQTSFSNPDLAEYKKKLLYELSLKSYSNKSIKFECNYHGIPLALYSASQELINALKIKLPESWKIPNQDSFQIEHYSTQELDISDSFWSDEREQDCLTEENNTVVIQRDFAARVLEGKRIILICEQTLGDGFYNFLRWFLAQKLIATNQYILHASCVLGLSGKAHFFLGHSGAGKTTVTELSIPRKILGDDMNILKQGQGGYLASPGAIGGIFKSDLSYQENFPIAAFYWLEQADTDQLTRFPQAQAQTKIAASFANLFWEQLPEAVVMHLLKASREIAQSFPTYQLQFRRSSNFWRLIND